MAEEVVESPVRIAAVDVAESIKENVSQRELYCDSGTFNSDTASVSCPSSSDSDVSPTKYSASSAYNDGESSIDLGVGESSPSKSMSEPPSSNEGESPLPIDEPQHRNDDTNFITSDTELILGAEEIKDQNMEPSNKMMDNIHEGNSESNDTKHNDTLPKSTQSPSVPTTIENKSDGQELLINLIKNSNGPEEVTAILPSVKANVTEKQNSEIELSITNKSLTMSTTSLNDEIQINNITDCKPPHSRSVENITTMEQNSPSSSNSSIKNLDADQILTEFTNQKNKVRATQKIVNETPQSTLNPDLRYARIPKDILTQDLGSIAKSVHGIFSSVSGSLKNVYNNSQKVSGVKLPIRNITKPVNGKVMTEIFEDNVPECNVASVEYLNADKEKVEGLDLSAEDSINPDMNKVDETKNDLMKLQIESLERVLAEQRKENSSLRERVKQQMDELQAKDHTFKELEAKVDLMCKRAEQAAKEKDAAVMRYASVECAAIEARRAADAARAAEKAATAERELMAAKLRSARDERERICQLYDDKCHELRGCEVELGKAREETRELDGRLKWTQSKLRVEMDAYKECSERAERLAQQAAELEAARGASATAASATDAAKAKQFEAELKESQAALILCRHEKEELERRLSGVTQLLDTCRRERDDASDALARTTAQVEKLKESNLRLEEEAAELAALRAQAALADTLNSQLQRESARASQAEEALVRERARGETCARREAAALQHAARLTADHVAQRAAAADADAKALALAADNASLRERAGALEAECGRLRAALAQEAERRDKENHLLARRVAELTEEVAEVGKQLEWERGENGVLKKKHASAIKELNRELARATKRAEQLEARLNQPSAGAPSTRTGSVTSLSSAESAQDERLQNGHADPLPDVHPSGGGPFPERQALIERIVQLQRAAARRAERCDFLEEHARALTAELRGKSKLLRRLLPALPAAALAPHDHDEHKKEIARLGGGAMAALWGGDGEGMTLELALEVARRLQALLEDTLLKNITLKENIDTLGEEIARLRRQSGDAEQPKP